MEFLSAFKQIWKWAVMLAIIGKSSINAFALSAIISGQAQLAQEINQLIQETHLDGQLSVYIKSMHFGDALYTFRVNKPMTPASILKIFTAEAALLFLGPEYRFATQLLTNAKKIKKGVLQGNLYVVLSGDPSLTYQDLVDLLMSLHTQQIQTIEGNVYIDNTAYDQSFYGPGWDFRDKGYCYAAPISASIINHNCISFKMTPAKVKGQTAEVVTSSKYFTPTIKNTVVTRAKSSHCGLHLTTNAKSVIAIDGCLPAGTPWGVSYVVADISEYDRALFKTLFRRLAIAVKGKVTFATAKEHFSLISQHASQPLRVLINDMLKKSDNVIAGALFKKVGQLYMRKPGSWENGSEAVAKILKEQAKLNTAGLRILDGSGLSPFNLITAEQIMQVLFNACHHQTNHDFLSALPVSGVDGTLKHRMNNIPYKARAKTGTISGVVTLAGYVETIDKELLGFVIMINGNKQSHWLYRSFQDELVTTLSRFMR